MRKLLAWILTMAMALGLAACGDTSQTQEDTAKREKAELHTEEIAQKTLPQKPREDTDGGAADRIAPLPLTGGEQYLADIDWAGFRSRVTAEEYAAIETYLPQLTGGEFTWIYRSGEGEEPDTYTHDRKQTTIQEMVSGRMKSNGLTPENVVVDSILFADVFQSGSKNICLLLAHLGWDWLILHEENGVVYGIDMPVRWFESVQDNGVYLGSGGAAYSYYHRMTFENGDYVEEDLGDVVQSYDYETEKEYSKLYIDGVEQSDADYQAWREKYLQEPVPWYSPAEETAK